MAEETRHHAGGIMAKGPLGLPWLAWGGIAVGLGVIGYLVYREMSGGGSTTAAQTAASQQASGVTSDGSSTAATPTAATVVPLPYPTTTSTTGTTSSGSVAPSLSPVWQFGTPQGSFVWQATGTQDPSGFPIGQALPGPNDPSNDKKAYPGFGANSWEWAPVPGGFTPSTYAQYINTQGASNPSAASLTSSNTAA